MTATEAKPRNILIVGPAWVGDMVMAQSLFRLLCDPVPGQQVDVVAPAWSEPLLARMPQVRRAIVMPVGHGEFGFTERMKIGLGLRGEQYEKAIVLPRSLKSALLPFFAGATQRTGFRGEMRYGLLNDVRELDPLCLDQTVKRFLALGLPGDAPLPDAPSPVLISDPENTARLLDELDLVRDALPIALMPGAAYGAAKCWPIDYFGQLAGSLSAAGHPVWVLGSDAERETGDAIVATAGATGGPPVRNLCGRTRLEDSVDLLAQTRVAVTNDSGLMHVAAAADTHVVAIYGSTSPEFTPPLTARKTIQYLELECSPCFQRECPLTHLNCLRDIDPRTVLEATLLAV